MIIDWLITFVVLLANSLISLLPNADTGLVSSIAGNWLSVKNWIVTTNAFFPVGDFLADVSICVAGLSGILLWKFGRWLLQIISGGIVKS